MKTQNFYNNREIKRQTILTKVISIIIYLNFYTHLQLCDELFVHERGREFEHDGSCADHPVHVAGCGREEVRDTVRCREKGGKGRDERKEGEKERMGGKDEGGEGGKDEGATQ